MIKSYNLMYVPKLIDAINSAPKSSIARQDIGHVSIPDSDTCSGYVAQVISQHDSADRGQISVTFEGHLFSQAAVLSSFLSLELAEQFKRAAHFVLPGLHPVKRQSSPCSNQLPPGMHTIVCRFILFIRREWKPDEKDRWKGSGRQPACQVVW